jgi:hypothetical protein
MAVKEVMKEVGAELLIELLPNPLDDHSDFSIMQTRKHFFTYGERNLGNIVV